MDPSIMKLLEDDEDESMHSGADVDALSAELTRDIGGDTSAMVPPREPDSVGILGQASISAPKQDFMDWQSSSQEENNLNIQQNKEKQQFQSSKQFSSEEDFIQQGLDSKTQDLQVRCQTEPERPPSQSDHLPQRSETNVLQEIEREQANKCENNQSSDICQGPNLEVAQQSESQQQHIGQQLNSQQVSMSSQASMEMRKMKGPASIPFHMLLPILRPHLDKDRSMQLQAVFNKLRNNEVSKEGFLRVIRNIVGDQMLRQAATKVQLQVARNAPANTNQFPLQAHASSQHHPTSGGQQISELQSFSPINSMPSSQSMKNVQMQAATSFSETGQNSRETDNKSDVKGVQVHNYPGNASLQSVKQHQSTQTSHAPFSVYGGTSNFNAFPYSTPTLNSQPSSIRPVNQDMHMRQASHTQGIASTQVRPYQAMTSLTAPRPEMPNTASETKKQHTGLVAGHSASQQNPAGWQSSANKDQRTNAFPSAAFVKQEVVDQTTESSSKSQFTAKDNSSFGSMHFNQGNSAHGSLRDEAGDKQPSKIGLTSSTSMIGRTQVSAPMTGQVDQSEQNQKQSLVSSTTSLLQAGTTAKTPQKKPSVGQKKPLEAPGSSPPMSNKKQKASGTFLDQSIEQLNDVTAVSGVNLREEEEQLLSAPKEESKASEATRRVVQEEEERLLLQKGPLQNKLQEIMLKHGLKTTSSDVLRCLSLCVEERLRGLMTNLVRLSKQRVDIEKTKHRFCITSDVQSQILSMNKKAKEEWDKKQAEEAEKLRKPNEGEGTAGVDAEKDKEENRSKNLKANKEEDDKMRTTAANVAARAAVGGDDMLSKWQLMAEQARQKREGLDVSSSGSQLGKSSTSKHAHNSGKRSREQHDSEKKGSAGGTRKFGRNPALSSHPTIVRNISIKDIIAALEREPQMSRSTLVYRLYEKLSSGSSAEQS